MKNNLDEHFPGFIYPASELSKFIAAGDIFIRIRLKRLQHFLERQGMGIFDRVFNVHESIY